MKHVLFSLLLGGASVIGVIATSGCTSTHHAGGGGGGGGGNGTCPAACTKCDMGTHKCLDCTPGVNACGGGAVVACNSDGTLGAQVKTCDTMNGEQCMNGDCLSPCQTAASSHSYIGCDYYAVTTLTSQLNPYFDFAVAVANPAFVGDVTQSAPATVTVTRAGKTIDTRMVMAGAVEVIMLPWVPQISQNPDCSSGACMPVTEVSSLVPDGAYHVVSTLPVTVYQFSPLQFEKPSSKTCHSYSTDASILLPTTALRNEYYAISRQTFSVGDPFAGGDIPIPGFVTIYGTVDNTTVTITSSAFTEAGKGIAALMPGQTTTVMVNAGQVLQLVSKRATSPCANKAKDGSGAYCDLGPKYDLTGTHIMADQPVGVFGGHACSFVPYNKWACDHLEEQITPLDTWGQHIIVAQTNPQIKGEPNLWRIISGSDANMITFDPPNVHAAITLGLGQYVEFPANGGFQVSGSGRIAVGQYMVGENFVDMTTLKVGDPSLGLGVPVEQYRNSYDFLSPSTYTNNYVTAIAATNTTLTLDGQPVNAPFVAIGGTGYGYAYIQLKAGAHHLSGGAPFGITVSGIANFTSYLYVGGQNLNDVPVQ